MPDPQGVAWSEGSLVPLSEAHVPLHALAVAAGESLFETFLLRPGGYFRLQAHLERMQAGLRRLGWHVPQLAAEFHAGCAAIATHCGGLHPWRVRATLCRMDNEGSRLWVSAVRHRPRWPSEGIAVRITTVRLDPAAPWAGLKCGNRLPHRLAASEAAAHGANEGLMLGGAGVVCEGSVTNVFWVREGRLYTPAVECGILPGITRDAVIGLANDSEVRVEQGAYPPEHLWAAEEVFVTNAVAGVVPVVTLDGCPA